MALERQTIERKDFPIGRRGYDPDAVDAHLAVLASEIEELKKSSRRRSETLASSASEQVRSIVEAAETSAAAIQREAEEEAAEIRAEASNEAQAAREQANAQAREYVSRVSEATAVMLQRIDAMESELGALVEALRTGSNRLNADLQLLESNLEEVRESAAPPSFEPEFEAASAAGTGELGGYGSEPPSVFSEPGGGIDEAHAGLEPPPPPPLGETTGSEPLAPAPPPAGEPAPPPGGAVPGAEIPEDIIPEDEFPGTEPVTEPQPAEPEPLPEPEPMPTGAMGGIAEPADETEGARLIALNMALNGTPREETDRYLAENFDLRDRSSLLDEVYASVDG